IQRLAASYDRTRINHRVAHARMVRHAALTSMTFCLFDMCNQLLPPARWLGISGLPILGVINDFIALFTDDHAIGFAALPGRDASAILSGELKNSVICREFFVLLIVRGTKVGTGKSIRLRGDGRKLRAAIVEVLRDLAGVI